MKIATKAVIKEIIWIIGIASFIGFISNYVNPKGVKITHIRPSPEFAADSVFAVDLPQVSIQSVQETEAEQNAFVEPVYIQVEQAVTLLKNNSGILLDARSKDEFKKGYIPGAENIPYTELELTREKIKSLPQNKWLICYCESDKCDKAELLAYELVVEGYNRIAILYGGLSAWQKAGYKIKGQKVD